MLGRVGGIGGEGRELRHLGGRGLHQDIRRALQYPHGIPHRRAVDDAVQFGLQLFGSLQVTLQEVFGDNPVTGNATDVADHEPREDEGAR